MTNGPPNKKYIFSQLLMSIIDKHQQILSTLQALQQRILGDELIRWKSTQNIFSNGVTFVNNLEQIQKWCEGLAEVIWENRQQMESVKLLCPNLAHMPSHNLNNRLSSLREQIAKLLEDLVTSTFIIENQPTQVIKTNSKFTATVHLLVGGQLNVNMTPPQVKVTIVNEEQVNSLLNSNDRDSLGKTSGQILNNKILMEYNSKERQLTANFKNMQLKKVKRSEKKGTEFVTDEKFSLLFQTKFKIGGDLDFHVWVKYPLIL
jgi:signal transducer and activator of transcription 5B